VGNAPAEDAMAPLSKATAKKRKQRANPEFKREYFQIKVIGADKIQVKSWRRMLCVSV